MEELENINLPDKLNRNSFANPSKNYDIFIKLLAETKQRILPRKRVKFNKKKHKKFPWMTNGILKSINSKDKLYKRLVNTPVNSLQYNTIKTNFNTYQNIIQKVSLKPNVNIIIKHSKIIRMT